MRASGLVVSGTLAAAYEHCETLTRREARNFSYGIRLLPADKRGALSAVYAFARRIDDIGDGDLPATEKLSRLAAARADLRAVERRGGDPVLVALADAARRHPIPLQAFAELIEGCEMDVRGTTYDTFDELVGYCRRVAGSIGRLSLGVFGADDPAAAAPLADRLGIALQQTNILRDVREDTLAGRVYLPRADVARFGVTLRIERDGSLGGPPERLAALVRAAAVRADGWYAEGLRLLAHLDRRSAACAAAMAGIYRRLLHRIAADPAAVLAGRMSLPAREKVVVAARSLAGRPT